MKIEITNGGETPVTKFFSATPETDAKASPHIGFYSCATVTADFARRLERERDEAREDVMKLQDIKRKHEHDELVAAQENDRLKQERDEAMRQLDNLKASSIHTCHDQCQRPMCVLRRERDEARQQIAMLLNKLDQLYRDVEINKLKEGAK
jgi:hypothetical protein